MTLFECRGLGVTRGGRTVLDDVSLRVCAGEVVGLIGPNGAGKTTLMRAALGLVPHRGRSSLAALPPAARSRHAAFLPQGRDLVWPLSVADLVSLGRMPHGRADPARIAAVLEETGLSGFALRRATELSGGEQARVLLARALAQDTPLLLADEPVAGLDPAQQIAVMQILAARAAAGRGILVSLHDLGLAARHCTRITVLRDGRLCADGPPREVLTPRLGAEIFGVTLWSADTPAGWMMQPVALAGGGR